jgi:hypothetical protein
MGVQEVTLDRSGTEPVGMYTFVYGKERESGIWDRLFYTYDNHVSGHKGRVC